MSPVTIGIDVGGTKIAGALITADGTISHEHSFPTPRTPDGADPGATATTALIHDLLEQADDAGLSVAAAGLGVPEYVNRSGDITSSEVLAWRADDLTEMRSLVRLVIDSDVRCAARAELRFGHGRGVTSFVFVSIGTGISHTLVMNDQIWAGHRGEAIALGELPVHPAKALRPSAPLTVEQQAAGLAIELALSSDSSAEEAEIVAAEIGVRAGHIVGSAIVSTIELFDPELVVLGGGLGTSTGPFTEALISRADELLERRPGAPSIRQSLLGSRAGLLGAGLRAHERDAGSRQEGPDHR